MKKIKHIIFALLMLICSAVLYAQDKPNNSDFGNIMRSNGRIYVVVAVIVTILLGLIIYLVRLDRKISRLEKNSV